MINILNAREYIENFLKIRDKKAQLIPFHLNPPQERLYNAIKAQADAGKPARIIILKARQMGFSTLTEGIFFWKCATGKNRTAMIVAHTDDATSSVFRMSRTFLENLPKALRPMTSATNAYEIEFNAPAKSKVKNGLGSRIRCATAGGQGIGRGDTLTAGAHLSEFAFWPGDKGDALLGIMQAVPNEAGTLVVIESTANGFDEFKEKWDQAVEAEREGRDGFTPIFFAWWEMPEYRMAVPPGFELTDEEREIKERYGLDDEQLAWRRWCIAVACGGSLMKFRQEYPACPDEAFIASGVCVFNQEDIVKRREAVRKLTPKVGYFDYDYDEKKITNIRFVEDKNGCVKIYKDPEERAPYVIGGDTAGTGSDYFIGQVLDNRTGEQVCVLRHQKDETYYTRQMYCLGTYYNTALVGIEVNYSSYPQKELQRLGYPRFYVRQRVESYTESYTDSYGFKTTSVTRPLIIDNLKAVVRESIELINDFETLGEMLTFVYNDNWRPEAMQGEHDDLVMALAIAHFIRPQQNYETEKLPAEKREWTEDMKQDYYHASPEEQKMLIKKWGEPL